MLTSASTSPLPEAGLGGLVVRFEGQKRRPMSRQPCYLSSSRGTPVQYWTDDPKYSSLHTLGVHRTQKPAMPVTEPFSSLRAPSGHDVLQVCASCTHSDVLGTLGGIVEHVWLLFLLRITSLTAAITRTHSFGNRSRLHGPSENVSNHNGSCAHDESDSSEERVRRN